MRSKPLQLLTSLLSGLALLTLILAALNTPNVTLATTSAANPLDVVISEIAWMGSTTSAYDEWIELHNNTATDIDLAGWRLVSNDGSPDVSLAGVIPANGRFLIERTDDTTTPALADQIHTSGGLNNSGEVITLTDTISNVIDIAGQSGPWFSGDNSTKATMERQALTSPGDVAGSWTDGPINGTPTNSIVDKDNDTFGYSINLDWTAASGPGYEQFAEDCDDSAPDIYPGAPELLNMLDEDCDGEIDEEFVLGTLDYAIYFNSGTTISATGATTGQAPMEQALLGFINATTQTIDVAIYGFNRESLKDALIAAHNRGVTVRVVSDNDEAGKPTSMYDALITAGIPVITGSASYLQHNKFAIFDEQVVWTGSTNWTDNGMTYNVNNSIVMTAAHVALAYTMEFEEMFVDGRFATQKLNNTPHVFTYTNAVVEIYFSPSDDVEARVMDAVSAAQDSMQFAMFYWTSDPLGQLVVTKAVTNGLDVWGVWDRENVAKPSSQAERLCLAGIPVKAETFSGKLHHKLAILDVFGRDPTVVVGSYNWTEAGGFNNDENTLIIHGPDIATPYYNEILTLYNALENSTICEGMAVPEMAATFGASPTTGKVPLTVQFTDESTGIITSRLWDFGDGVTSDLQNPWHTYNTTGAYTVTLTVSGPGGNHALEKASYINVLKHTVFLPLIITDS